MNAFPRTEVGGISLPRMIVGTNWFLGFSHATASKDKSIRERFSDRSQIADVLEVFFRAGINAVMGLIDREILAEAIKEAEDRTGVESIIISTPGFPITPAVAEKGLDLDEAARILDVNKSLGAHFCMPHQSTTDALVDRCTGTIRHIEPLLRMTRERGMCTGLSTHMPESIVYADATGIDVDTYIGIYNAMGFLMQVEVDWIARVITNAKKPVMTIKPMAAGQLRPFQALAFVWSTLRPCDMVTVGTMSPDEAAELIDISMSLLEGRASTVKLQETRSKQTLKG